MQNADSMERKATKAKKRKEGRKIEGRKILLLFVVHTEYHDSGVHLQQWGNVSMPRESQQSNSFENKISSHQVNPLHEPVTKSKGGGPQHESKPCRS